jgi:hypothetical protein
VSRVRSRRRSRHKAEALVYFYSLCCSCSKEENFLKLSGCKRLSRGRSSKIRVTKKQLHCKELNTYMAVHA